MTQEVAPEVTPEVAPEVRVLPVYFEESRKCKQTQPLVGLKEPDHYCSTYLQPTQEAGLIDMTIPDKPHSSFQKYRLTTVRRTATEAVSR